MRSTLTSTFHFDSSLLLLRFAVLIMAGQVNWEQILKDRFPTYKVEEDAFIDSLQVAHNIEVYMERIYDAIRNDPNVHVNLKMLYREAISGGNNDVVKRIKNRISNIRRNCRLVFIIF